MKTFICIQISLETNKNNANNEAFGIKFFCNSNTDNCINGKFSMAQNYEQIAGKAFNQNFFLVHKNNYEVPDFRFFVAKKNKLAKKTDNQTKKNRKIDGHMEKSERACKILSAIL